MNIGLAHCGYTGTGGSENYLLRFAAEARAQGHALTLFTSRWPGGEWPHGELVTIPSSSQTEFAEKLRASRPRERCDFLFALDRVAECDCFRAGGGSHAGWLDVRRSSEPWWKMWFVDRQRRHRDFLALERRMFSPSATPRVIAISEYVKREIVRYFNYPASRVRVVYNGVPPLAFDPSARARLRRELGYADGDCVAIFVGNGWKRKGLAVAMRAACRAGVHLVVLGRDKKIGLPRAPLTRFVGAVRPVNDWLAMADVFILPTRYDPFSNACLEASAAGLPVIVSGMAGFSEIVTGSVTGTVVADPADADGFAAALDYWRPAARRAEAQPLCRALAGQFNITRNVSETLAWFQEPLADAQV